MKLMCTDPSPTAVSSTLMNNEKFMRIKKVKRGAEDCNEAVWCVCVCAPGGEEQRCDFVSRKVKPILLA